MGEIRETERQYEQVIADVRVLAEQLGEKVDELRAIVSRYEQRGEMPSDDRWKQP